MIKLEQLELKPLHCEAWKKSRIMANLTQGSMFQRVFDRERVGTLADALAVAVAMSLPWSTSLTDILVALWLIALLPTLDVRSLLRGLSIPAAALPVAFCLLGIIGMAWADVDLTERLGSVKVFLRL